MSEEKDSIYIGSPNMTSYNNTQNFNAKELKTTHSGWVCINYNTEYLKERLTKLKEESNNLKQTISNIFREEEFPHKPKRKRFIPNEPEEEPLKATKIQKFNFGLVVGSNKGNLLFIEKNPNNDYIPV